MIIFNAGLASPAFLRAARPVSALRPRLVDHSITKREQFGRNKHFATQPPRCNFASQPF
jgi:hypothetical protein